MSGSVNSDKKLMFPLQSYESLLTVLAWFLSAHPIDSSWFSFFRCVLWHEPHDFFSVRSPFRLYLLDNILILFSMGYKSFLVYGCFGRFFASADASEQ